MRETLLFVAVGLQVVSVLVCALVAWLGSDTDSARFVLLGGASAAIPNALFALRLAIHRGRRPESYPVVLFAGELIKIAMSIGALAMVVRTHADVRWLALLVGWIVALKAPLLLLPWWMRRERLESARETRGQTKEND